MDPAMATICPNRTRAAHASRNVYSPNSKSQHERCFGAGSVDVRVSLVRVKRRCEVRHDTTLVIGSIIHMLPIYLPDSPSVGHQDAGHAIRWKDPDTLISAEANLFCETE